MNRTLQTTCPTRRHHLVTATAAAADRGSAALGQQHLDVGGRDIVGIGLGGRFGLDYLVFVVDEAWQALTVKSSTDAGVPHSEVGAFQAREVFFQSVFYAPFFPSDRPYSFRYPPALL